MCSASYSSLPSMTSGPGRGSFGDIIGGIAVDVEDFEWADPPMIKFFHWAVS